jgi:TPR repeat protein
MFDHGQVDAHNRTARTAQLWQLAAAQGHAGAQCNLGIMFETGRGFPRDVNEAARWFRLASEGQGAGEAREFALKGLRRLGMK